MTSLLRRAGGRTPGESCAASNSESREAYTVEMPSIGLMSPTKRSRSAIVNSPGVFDGSSGFQFLPFSHRYDWWSPCTRPTNTSATIVAPTGPSRSPLAALLRLLQDVVPERRVLMQAVLLGDRAIGPVAISSGVSGFVIFIALATSCPDGSPSMTPRFRLRNGRAAAAARQRVQRRDDERIELARGVEWHAGADSASRSRRSGASR